MAVKAKAIVSTKKAAPALWENKTKKKFKGRVYLGSYGMVEAKDEKGKKLKDENGEQLFKRVFILTCKLKSGKIDTEICESHEKAKKEEGWTRIEF